MATEEIMLVLGCTLILLVFFVIFSRNYKIFKVDVYVVHIRAGRVRRTSLGGGIVKLPVIDRIILIPATVQHSILEFDIGETILKFNFSWRVKDPSLAVKHVSWSSDDQNYASRVIDNLSRTMIWNAFVDKDTNTITENQGSLLEQVSSNLQGLTGNWGIEIESVTGM
ncbi:MAG: SPFH domain-containing protein [Candidatus Odinarchaeota archaeon]